jgi:AraC family transcriptional regulator
MRWNERILYRAQAKALTGRDTRGPSRSPSGLSARKLSCLVHYIETHLADKIATKDLATHVNLSISHLNRMFKLSVGVTPHNYVSMRRVELVCTMLITTRRPLSQVAFECGWSDQSHLCKVFRRTMGMTPSGWRRAMTVARFPKPPAGGFLPRMHESCEGVE